MEIITLPNSADSVARGACLTRLYGTFNQFAGGASKNSIAILTYIEKTDAVKMYPYPATRIFNHDGMEYTPALLWAVRKVWSTISVYFGGLLTPARETSSGQTMLLKSLGATEEEEPLNKERTSFLLIQCSSRILKYQRKRNTRFSDSILPILLCGDRIWTTFKHVAVSYSWSLVITAT